MVERLRAGTGVRVITYDQRGHGRSTAGRSATSVRALGDDLAEVLAVAAPSGPVVLAGHSMGGMAVMAYAGLHPQQVQERVAGVVLVSTSSGDLAGGRSRLQNLGLRVLSRAPRLPAGVLVTVRGQRRLLFGPGADAESVRLTRGQVAGTSLPTLGRFYSAFDHHDETASLAALQGIPTTVLVGDHDRLTPLRHAQRLGELIPGADVRVLPGRGHMLTYEAPDTVAGSLLRMVLPLLDRAAAG